MMKELENIIYNILKNGLNLYSKTDIEIFSEKKKITNINFNFIPTEIVSWIYEKINYNYTYKFKINEKNIQVKIFSEKIIREKNKYIKTIFIILYLLSNFSNKECCKNIFIEIYLTPFKKTWNYNKNLTEINVNTGYSTFGCHKNSYITIFREEEWKKVLIHELMHNLNLDFSDNFENEYKIILKDNFYINSKYDVFETYCEIWARFLNVCYFSFNQSNTLKNFNYNLNINFKKEINYSLKQANQIFSIIYLNDYKEETNIFCYYILTSVLMFYYKDFFIWCKNNNYNYINFNKDKNNILNFIKLLINKFYSEEYISIVSKKNYSSKSLRMTIIE